MKKWETQCEQDEAGQWWYRSPGTGARQRAQEASCERCGEMFVARSIAVQRGGGRWCSVACANQTRADARPKPTPRNEPGYEQDDFGQWWYVMRNGKRQSAIPKVCEECGGSYLARLRQKIAGRFCSIACANRNHSRERIGEKHPRWNGGRFVHSDGYVRVTR